MDKKLDRRTFVKKSAMTAMMMQVGPWDFVHAQSDHLLSRKAYRSTSEEGNWSLNKIEGTLPKNLQGELIRVGPGAKENNGQKLNHFFDGDAYFNRYRFSSSQVSLEAHFIKTPEREEEQFAKKMIYDEFGTEAPKRTRQLKNQPNVNIVKWNDEYLALSEGGAPCLLAQDLSFKRHLYFSKTLKKNIGFAAHPKRDPLSGKMYGFGIEQSIRKALVVFEMDEERNQLKQLYKMNQKHVHMIHDMAMTENYLIFLIPPAYFKLSNIILDRGSMADALRFDPSMGSRLIVCRKDGQEEPFEIKVPSKLLFHHANAYEKDGKLYLMSCVADDASLLQKISRWHHMTNDKVKVPNLTKFVFDLEKRQMLSEDIMVRGHDFPTLNLSYLGKEARYLYSTQMGSSQDPMAFKGISKLDTVERRWHRYQIAADEIVGECVYVATDHLLEDSGHLLVPGYNATKDESFLDVVHAQTLTREARIWSDRYLPLGFHGNFYR